MKTKLLLYFWEAVQERYFKSRLVEFTVVDLLELSKFGENLQSKNEQFIKSYKTVKTKIKQKRG
ncbi:hypothetical protein NCCP2140_03450 [Pseudoalteromonas sp. NCCP-2140]|nr:hypothetical protein NCCP2140_03450 [Pseudoalteromonas sp. NCCP-2140]